MTFEAKRFTLVHASNWATSNNLQRRRTITFSSKLKPTEADVGKITAHKNALCGDCELKDLCFMPRSEVRVQKPRNNFSTIANVYLNLRNAMNANEMMSKAHCNRSYRDKKADTFE